LSSGSKIVSPEDDAAGLAVSLRFDAQISRTRAANNNVGNAVSFSQTQDGFMQKVGKALDRMSELSILAQDITKTDEDRALYQKEFDALGGYIDNVGTKDFNGVSLFDGVAKSVTIDGEGTLWDMATLDLGGVSAYHTAAIADISTTAAAVTALDDVKAAITKLTEDRANIGANISRLTYTGEQLGVLRDNLAAANSRLKDVDVAEESTQFARYNILVQSGTAMLAQANATPQSALQLLQ
jgi:flagellin